ncbi:MAG: type I-MYXAN CRISPR-associated protein Cas6/Cmx6 [Sterolibacterium sp.]|nr:type I-MYXAN CRISPR-associated protein Cas6/Cmx6 [Sterolibacterium sp.]
MSALASAVGDTTEANEVVDVLFALRGNAIATDYALPLWQALQASLPWLAEEPDVSILPLARVSQGQGNLFLGRHTRLELRLPQRLVDAAYVLCGLSLDLGAGADLSGTVEICSASLRPLRPAAVQYSSFVTLGHSAEAEFVDEAKRLLDLIGVDCQLVCGKARTQPGDEIAGMEGTLRGFSLMLHGLTREDSLRIQRTGLGAGRKLGCGIFVPHKSVVAVAAN